MCTKTSKTPLLLIGGVCFVIVLVGITGVTLINNLNLSNIIKLNEKVASDSMSAHDTELHEINYANNHPKNIYKFDEFSAPYALAVASYSYSQHTASSAAAAHALPPSIHASPALTGGGGPAAIAGPAVAFVDAEANSGNAAADKIIEVLPQANERQQGLDSTSQNWLKENGKLHSRGLPIATSAKTNTIITTETAADASTTLVNNPHGNTMQSNASVTLSASAPPTSAPSNVSTTFRNATSVNTNNANAASASVSVSSAAVDIAAKLMLPLILNGSASVSVGSGGENGNEEHSIEVDTAWGFPSDNRMKSADTHTSKGGTAMQPGRLLVPSEEEGVDKEKRDRVVKMMLHAWENYKLYAWGKNELRPLSQRPHSGSIFGAYDLGATIVDGLDTLYLMGLEKEYQEGRDWIERKFSLDNISADLSVFETNIRFVGGMLTLYAFTGDNLYKEKAQHIADKLLPAFQTPTGIPYALVNTRTGASRNYGWASGGSSILSEVGTLHCEFVYLSDITGNPLYRERVQTIRQVLKEIEKPKGLYPNFINPKTGKWGQMHMSLGALGDSFFEYLLKAWLQSGQVDEEAREMFDDAMVSINEHMIRTSSGGLTYVSDLKFDRLEHKMDHLACFAGGLFALAANTRQNQYANKFMEIGKGLTNTCHESYARTATKLGPEAFRFSDAAEARALKSQEKYYILRPETIESYFVLWRLTHDQKYRDWGWEAVQALEAHCRTPHGYCGIKNVYQEMPQKDDVQQSFFLAETLKYLYLLFSDDSLLPLDEWIFNTEAHPLPVRSANVFYRAAPPAQTQADENR
ncbi:PREDICTED: mannosyl-oligosaccharide alpha-1,2-mannosidase IA-like [Rhagoletis zephyria]|uniref:mannosyl-oligosaccharide alpha-1,2-mannosidase IA-like n=2 Tax=Rhagoletis zephyria TaxID=28612 RepID=UPI0008114E9B|nr:PREDICTED: mannosyl-oligosaccharide alpha-1,2-mannosidase IA-like [Rhagoletis zephyria]